MRDLLVAISVEYCEMRKRVTAVSIVLIVLAFFALARSLRSGRATGFPLSAVILGYTNAPGRAWRYGTSTGMYVLLGVTNRAKTAVKDFGIDAIETRGDDGWKEHLSDLAGSGLGADWGPGYGIVYAIPWPADLPTDASSRLRLWVDHEPFQLVRRVARTFRITLSSRPHRYTVFATNAASRIVASAQTQSTLLGSQKPGPVNVSQPVGSETSGPTGAVPNAHVR